MVSVGIHFVSIAPMTNVGVSSNFTAVLSHRHRVFISQIIFVSKHHAGIDVFGDVYNGRFIM